jgi:hypothetical protein
MEKIRISWPDGRTVADLAGDGAGKDHTVLDTSIPVVGIIVPADHVGEGVVAVPLREPTVVLDEKVPV